MIKEFSVDETAKIRQDYSIGGTKNCPRCGSCLMSFTERGPLLQGQRPGGPEFEWLVVDCPKGHYGRILWR